MVEGTITVRFSFETYIAKVASCKKHGLSPGEWGGKTHMLLFHINILLTCDPFPEGNFPRAPVVCVGDG